MYGIERIEGIGPPWVETLFVYNPFYVYMSLFRGSLLEEGPAAHWGAAALYALVMFVVGLWFFRRRELEYGHA